MFIFTKLAGPLTDPVSILMLLLMAGAGLCFTRFRRWGRGLVAFVALFWLAVASLPVGAWINAGLEERFPPPDLPERLDGILVLGGGVDQVVRAARGQMAVTAAAERMLVVPDLARRYPEARIVFTGGSGRLLHQDVKEVDAAAEVFAAIGLPPERILFEGESRNTRENALFTLEMMRPKPGENWLLVTSASHMPRSVGVFRAAGWPVIPYPVDYRTTGRERAPVFAPLHGLHDLSEALREWRGLIVYRLAGWTDSLYPAP
ncbi:YdcF family protein [Telmatospirillum sp. J64-1]|uniref:YdcF family protein n=1 Tax=Telmatospirillum sp. J64-1 TaxID=2502183 RepID=UPI00115D2C76|nr:YdcF family protein [Telmatospirillum sp. J64-1]